MAQKSETSAVCVLTARGLDRILQEGGSQAWVLDAKRAMECSYVVCVQNHVPDDWGQATADDHVAFVVGRLSKVVRSSESSQKVRWMLMFDSYAVLNEKNAWPGNRNPVFYSDLESLKINLNELDFKPMPSKSKKGAVTPLTLKQAKDGLAVTFGVDSSAIEITIKG